MDFFSLTTRTTGAGLAVSWGCDESGSLIPLKGNKVRERYCT